MLMMGCTSSLRAEEKHQLPILALLFTVGLSTTLTSLNRNQPAQDQPIMHALFTVEVAIMYALYMLISRILALALSCIEPSQPKKEEEEHLVWDDLEEEGPPARGVIHREALISSMYLGGSGCFLALPALSFWDLSVTCMLLLSLTCIGLWGEDSKHAELAPNQDKAAVLLNLLRFRRVLYMILLILILLILGKDMHLREPQGWPIMFLLAFISPLLLRLALPKTSVSTVMAPSQVHTFVWALRRLL
jgi:hypothetical protein